MGVTGCRSVDPTTVLGEANANIAECHLAWRKGGGLDGVEEVRQVNFD